MTDRVAKTLLIGLLVGWAWCWEARLADWQSDTTLWASAVRVAPTTRAVVNYASALIETGQWEAAIPWLTRVMTSSDPRAQILWPHLLRRAQVLQDPVCDVPAFAAWCAP